MEQMLGLVRSTSGDHNQVVRMEDGWCRALDEAEGFHFEYDRTNARGGWDFHRLDEGLSLAIIDVTVEAAIERRHALTDHLVISAVLEGKLDIADLNGIEGGLSDGFATVFGLLPGQAYDTVYRPGQHLQWVTVFIDRRHFLDLTGFDLGDLSEDVRNFLSGTARLPYHSVPLSNAAALAIHQILSCELTGGFRRSLYRLKTLELTCRVLHALADPAPSSGRLTQEEIERVDRALGIIQAQLDSPLTINELATAVGLNRKRLQFGFRVRYGDTVGQIHERIRMERALELIRGSSMSITDIAFETGYEHPASFTRAFKSAFGISPLAFRNAESNSGASGKR
jgi:AraC-like DNA-binding protein